MNEHEAYAIPMYKAERRDYVPNNTVRQEHNDNTGIDMSNQEKIKAVLGAAGCAMPGHEIAADAGITLSQMQKAAFELKKKGLLTVEYLDGKSYYQWGKKAADSPQPAEAAAIAPQHLPPPPPLAPPSAMTDRSQFADADAAAESLIAAARALAGFARDGKKAVEQLAAIKAALAV